VYIQDLSHMIPAKKNHRDLFKESITRLIDIWLCFEFRLEIFRHLILTKCKVYGEKASTSVSPTLNEKKY